VIRKAITNHESLSLTLFEIQVIFFNILTKITFVTFQTGTENAKNVFFFSVVCSSLIGSTNRYVDVRYIKKSHEFEKVSLSFTFCERMKR
jgi:hypothetical protein